MALSCFERAKCLFDIGVDLIQRMEETKHAILQKDYIKEGSLMKIASKAETKLPELPEFPKEKSSSDVLLHFAEVLVQDISAYYDLTVAALRFHDEVIVTLRSVCININVLKLSRHGCGLLDFFRLLSLLGRMHVAWAGRVSCASKGDGQSGRESLLVLYGLACISTSSSMGIDNKSGRGFPSDYPRIISQVYLYQYPLGGLAKELADISIFIGQIIQELRMSMEICLSTGTLLRLGTLDPLVKTSVSKEPVSPSLSAPDIYQEMLHVHSYVEWILWSCLLCPTEILDPKVMLLLELALSEIIILPVSESQSLNIVAVFSTELWDWFQPAKDLGRFGLAPGVDAAKQLRKLMRDMMERLGFSSPVSILSVNFKCRHLERWSYLVDKLYHLYLLFVQDPTLLPSKLPMALAAIGFSSAEVRQAFCHLNNHIKAPHEDLKKVYGHALIGGLITESIRLLSLISDHSSAFSQFWSRHLLEFETFEVKSLAVTVFALDTYKFKDITLAMMKVLVDALEQPQQPCNNRPSDLKGFRLDIYRLVEALSLHNSKLPATDSLWVLTSRLTYIAEASRYIDALAEIIKEKTPVQAAWKYQDTFLKFFQNSLEDSSCCWTSMLYLSAFGHSCLSVTSENPQSESDLNNAAELLSEMYTLVKEKISLLIQEIAIDTSQTQLVACSNTHTKPREEQKSRSSNVLQSRKQSKRTLAFLLAPLPSMHQFQVGHLSFHPIQTIQAQLQYIFQEWALTVLFPSGMECPPRFPVEALALINGTIAAAQIINLTCGINAVHLWRQTFSQIFTLLQLGTRSLSYSPPLPHTNSFKGSDNKPQINAGIFASLCSFYITLIQDLRDKPGLYKGAMFAGTAEGFVATDKSLSKDKKEIVRAFLSPHGISALVLVLGPEGVANFEKLMLNRIAKYVERIQGYLSEQRVLLLQQHSASSVDLYKKIPGAEDTMDWLICLGNLLCFRKLMLQALHNACIANPNLQKELVSFNGFAEILCTSPENDFRLKKVLLDKIPLSGLAGSSWGLVPFGIASLLRCESWKLTQYDVCYQGFSRNEHMISASLICILATFFDSKESREDVAKKLMAACSSVYFNLKCDKTGKFFDFPLQAFPVFFHQLNFSLLGLTEQNLLDFPELIVRQSRISLAMGKQRLNDAGLQMSKCFVNQT